MSKAILIKIVTAIVIIGAIGSVVALYTNLWSPSWNPFKEKPEIVLAKAIKNIQELKTFHYTGKMKIEFLNKEKFSIGIDMTGDIDNTNKDIPKSSVSIKGSFLGEGMELSVKGNLVSIGEEAYGKIEEFPKIPSIVMMFSMLGIDIEKIKNVWIKIDEKSLKNFYEKLGIKVEKPLPKEEQEKLLNELKELLKGKEFLKIKTDLGEKEIDGKKVYHYLVLINKEELKKIFPEILDVILKYSQETISQKEKEEMLKEIPQMIDKAFEEIGELDFEIWIGKKDKMIYKISFDKEIDISKEMISSPSGGKIKISGNFNFSKFNEKIEIKKPTEFKTLDEIIVVPDWMKNFYQFYQEGTFPEGLQLPQ